MIPGICWQTFNCKNIAQAKALNDTGFKCLRIFFNLCDVRQKRTNETWQYYINDLFVNMPDGLKNWTFEGKTEMFCDNSKMRDSFDFCKKYNWLPIVCLGYQEETPHNWIGRAPSRDKFPFLFEFTQQLGLYLYNTYGFDRADVEVWNEPTKLQGLGFGYDKYIELSLLIAEAWKSASINYKVHVFADDILRNEYLEKLLNHYVLMNKVDYIAVHIGVGSEDSEWEDKLLKKLYNRIKELGLKVNIALTEMNFNGIWDRKNQLVITDKDGNLIDEIVDIFAGILWIRKDKFGTATRLDDLWLTKPGSIKCTSDEKVLILKNFIIKYYKPYEIIEEDMKLDKIYKLNSHGIGVKFVQKVVNAELMPEPLLIEDGIWGAKTTIAVKDYQKLLGLVQDGIVGEKTMKSMIDNYPEIWNEIEYEWAIGER